MKTVALVGTFDSKGPEFLYVKQLLEQQGLKTLTIHTGVFEPTFTPDLSNQVVAAAAGGDIAVSAANKDRASATELLSKGIETLLPKLYAAGKFDGILSLGGSGGTAIVTAGMRALPIGVPKLMVSTMASGNTAHYVGTSDLIMMPSVVDVAGVNRISSKIFVNAAFAMAGMLSLTAPPHPSDKPLIAVTMFGVTTPCANYAKEYLEQHGYEVLIFHATGTGGRTMERLIENKFFAGVLDLTTTEWCDQLVGGVLNGGPNRLEAAGRSGIPQVVSTGALDMVNFGPFDTVPERFKDRIFYKHNPTVTLMRTTIEENKRLGHIIAAKLNAAQSPTALMLPLKGVSMLDVKGQPFYGPHENAALFESLKSKLDQSKVELIELNYDINNQNFAVAAAQKLIQFINSQT